MLLAGSCSSDRTAFRWNISSHSPRLQPGEFVVCHTYGFMVGESMSNVTTAKEVIDLIYAEDWDVCVFLRGCGCVFGVMFSAVLCVKDTCLIHYLIWTPHSCMWQTLIRTLSNNITMVLASRTFLVVRACVCVEWM